MFKYISHYKKSCSSLSFRDVEVQSYKSSMIVIYELCDVRPMIDLYVYSYLRSCAAYDVTIKAMEFDEIRVRYRVERRNMIREIIIVNLIKEKLDDYLQKKTEEMIPIKDRIAFIKDVKEDLDQLDESRIAGLGIVSEQLENWLSLYKLT